MRPTDCMHNAFKTRSCVALFKDLSTIYERAGRVEGRTGLRERWICHKVFRTPVSVWIQAMFTDYDGLCSSDPTSRFPSSFLKSSRVQPCILLPFVGLVSVCFCIFSGHEWDALVKLAHTGGVRRAHFL